MKRELAQRLRGLLDLIVTVAVGAAAVLLIWKIAVPHAEPPKQVARLPVVEDLADQKLDMDIGSAHWRGAERAPIVLVEFSDFECPFCARHAREVFGLLDREFVTPGHVRYVAKHFPLAQMHLHVEAAAMVAECAGVQGQFWKTREELFARHRVLNLINWVDFAHEMALDSQELADCVSNDRFDDKIQADVQAGTALGVSSTPTFFVGYRDEDGRVRLTGRLRGAAPFSVFEEALRAAMKMNSTARQRARDAASSRGLPLGAGQ